MLTKEKNFTSQKSNHKYIKIALCMILKEIVIVKQISHSKYSMNTKKTRFGVIPPNQRLYSYNLQEDLYLEEFSRKNSCYIFYKKKNFLGLKRHLYSMRFYALHKNTRSLPLKKNTKFYLDIMPYNNLIFLEPLILILPLGLSRVSSIQNALKTFVKTKVSSSFHAAFSFIENQWQSCFYALEGEMPSSLHPEILIRMIGFQIKDVAFIDLLRRRLHTTSLNLTHPSAYIKHDASKNLTTIVWNLWVLEFEDFLKKEFITLFDKFSKSSHNSESFLQKFYFLNSKIQKIKKKNGADYFESLREIQYRLNVRRNRLKNGNYLRYANNCLIGIEDKLLVIQALKRRCIRFWKRRMGILILSSRLVIISLYQNNSWFLGSILKLKFHEIQVKITRSDALLLPTTILTKKKILVIFPLLSLVKLLSEYGFCKSNGFPISKSSWSTLPDSKIIERFSHILVSISCHYGGCENKINLSHIQYILCYSCAKTLACKHKTNLRSIWHTYANEFKRNNLLLQKIDAPNLNLLAPINKIFIKQKRIAIWDFSHLNPDPMILVFIEKRNTKNMV
jgi:hypothetical protein